MTPQLVCHAQNLYQNLYKNLDKSKMKFPLNLNYVRKKPYCDGPQMQSRLNTCQESGICLRLSVILSYMRGSYKRYHSFGQREQCCGISSVIVFKIISFESML